MSNFSHAPITERIWRRVDKNGSIPAHQPELGPCWPWIGAHDKRGYGRINSGGKRGNMLLPHRVAWAVARGIDPLTMSPNLIICHHCDNPPCCRNDHLFAGTKKDNTQDSIAKGRFSRQPGELHPRAKLTDAQVVSIRALHAGNKGRKLLLAKRFGVGTGAIRAIIEGKTWRHLLPPAQPETRLENPT